MELSDYLRVMRRRWAIVLMAVLVGVGTAVVGSMLTTPQYRAEAQVFVSTQAGDSAADLYQGSNFAQQRVRSYADIATTPKVLAPAIEKLGLAVTPDELARRTTASIPPETVLINLSVTDQDPATAAAVANAVADSFVATVTELETPAKGGVSPVRVSIVEQAQPPRSPASPNIVRNVGLGLVLGLLVGVGLALLRHTLDTRITTEDDVRAVTDATLIGAIPHDAEAESRPLVVQADPHSIRAEALRQVRTNLQFVDVAQQRRSFVISSSVPGEGKSSTACNLAITLAEAGSRVCIVEADLRRPKASEYFGVEGSVGLTTVLIGEAELEDVLQPWGNYGMYVLPAGQSPPNPSELLGSQAMLTLLKSLEAAFDHVLIDAPPLLPVTDAAVLSKIADGVIVVVGSGTAEKRELERALANLQAVDARLLGLVINRLPTKGPGSYGYAAYGYAPVKPQGERTHRLAARHERSPSRWPLSSVARDR